MLDQQRNPDLQGKRLDLNAINEQLANDLSVFRSLDPSRPSNWEGKDSVDNFKKTSYGRELQDQITQRQEQKYMDLHKERQNDLRLMRERLENDPFGKQGSGAPLRDQYGNIITSKNKALHQLHDYPRGQFSGAQPAFSLKARLARENLLTQSLDAGASPPTFDQNRRALSQADMPVQNMQQGMMMPQQSLFPMIQPIYLPPPPNYYYPPPPNYYTPQHNYPPQSLGAFTERGRDDFPQLDRTITRDLSHKRYVSVDKDLAYPYADKMREKEKRKERIQTYVDYQNDLLLQIDEKRRRRENEEDLKKIEDELDTTRIKRENEEIRAQDQAEADKRKRALERSQQINDKLSAGLNFVVTKGKGKRARTPIEEVEERLRMEKSMKDSAFGLTIKTEKDEKSPQPQEAKSPILLKNLTPIEKQMIELKGVVNLQNTFLQDQIIDVKKKMLDVARERIYTNYEVEELRHNLRQQRVIDEIKRTEMYDAMLHTSYKTPALFPTTTIVTPAIDDLGISSLLSSSTLAPTNRYKPSTARLVDRLNSRPISTASGFNSRSGMDYLSYFGPNETHSGIAVNDNGRYNLPEAKTDEYTPYKISDSVGSVLKRNKEKLEVLEDLERRGTQAYGEKIGLMPAKKTSAQVNDEVSQMLDGLLVDLDASKQFMDRIESRNHLDKFLRE